MTDADHVSPVPNIPVLGRKRSRNRSLEQEPFSIGLRCFRLLFLRWPSAAPAENLDSSKGQVSGHHPFLDNIRNEDMLGQALTLIRCRLWLLLDDQHTCHVGGLNPADGTLIRYAVRWLRARQDRTTRSSLERRQGPETTSIGGVRRRTRHLSGNATYPANLCSF